MYFENDRLNVVASSGLSFVACLSLAIQMIGTYSSNEYDIIYASGLLPLIS